MQDEFVSNFSGYSAIFVLRLDTIKYRAYIADSTPQTRWHVGFLNELLATRLDSVKFSFQGVDEKTYQQMRQNSSFKKLIENIKYTHKLSNESVSGGGGGRIFI